MPAEKEDQERDGDQEGEKVRTRLHGFDAGQPEERGQDEYKRHKEDALSAGCQKRRAGGKAEA